MYLEYERALSYVHIPWKTRDVTLCKLGGTDNYMLIVYVVLQPRMHDNKAYEGLQKGQCCAMLFRTCLPGPRDILRKTVEQNLLEVIVENDFPFVDICVA